MPLKYLFRLMLLTGLLVSCGSDDSSKPQDRLLAKVFDKSLYLSDMANMIPESASHEDSMQIINAYSERWVREVILMHEAENNIPKDLNLDKLVRDYRASLVRANYEKSLVDTQLDSVITMAELSAFYEKNKDQYELETPIMRCYLVKIPRSAPDLDAARQQWEDLDKGDNLKKLAQYCSKHAKVYMLDANTWYKVEDLSALVPHDALNSEHVSKGELTLKDDHYQYFIKVLEVVNKREKAPFSYIKDQAVKYILHKRKMKLLDDKIEELYKKELDNKNIQIYNF